jgi:hypothetical protein
MNAEKNGRPSRSAQRNTGSAPKKASTATSSAAAEREAAMDEILGLTPGERGETEDSDSPAPSEKASQTQSRLVKPSQT